MCNFTVDLHSCGHKSYNHIKSCGSSCSRSSSFVNHLNTKCKACLNSSSPRSEPRSSYPRHHTHSNLLKSHRSSSCNTPLSQSLPFDGVAQEKGAEYIPRSSCPAYSNRPSMPASLTADIFAKYNSFALDSDRSNLAGPHTPAYLYGVQNFIWNNSNYQW